jgi:hypothetical protein
MRQLESFLELFLLSNFIFSFLLDLLLSLWLFLDWLLLFINNIFWKSINCFNNRGLLLIGNSFILNDLPSLG